MPRSSAGLLLYRFRRLDAGEVGAGENAGEVGAGENAGESGRGGSPRSPGKAQLEAHLEVLIVHPGGPFWSRKDDGAWSIPKGEYDTGEDPEACAKREFLEELGVSPPEGPWAYLGEVVQRSGKRVRAWAAEGDLDVSQVRSNTFEMEWPPRSGHTQAFPEVDEARWVGLEEARRKLVSAQVELVDRLVAALS